MFDPASDRAWRFYVDDMIEFSERAVEYTTGFDRDGFVADRMRYDATLCNSELIGEAAGRVPESVRGESPQVPWRRIIAVRNRLAHAYLGIDDDVIWSIVSGDLPSLIVALRALRSEWR